MIMAGEIQELRALNFQEDSLHSGSISFGRFEAESLSWERRSSFSHNRYLEEVEKYSKPGSVTEKKAYFEAHFRRKALLSHSSSECQNGIDYQATRNDVSKKFGYSGKFENNNEGKHYIEFDKSLVGSEYGGESEMMEHDIEDMGTSHAESVFESSVNDSSVGVQSVCEHLDHEEARQIETKSFTVIGAEPGREVTEEFHSRTTPIHDSASSQHQKESCLEVGSQSGTKPLKAKSKPLGNISRVQRKVSSALSKVAAEKTITIERDSLRTTKSEKQSPQRAAPTTRSVHKTSKPEDSESSKPNVIHATKSQGELKSKKLVEHKPSVSDKVVLKARQTTNRPKQVENSTRPGMKQSSAVFSSEGDQQAAQWKEEKSDAEIKQLRKSLNFSATPMPSFYHEAVKRDEDRDKAVSSNTKSNKLTSKSPQVCRAARKSPSYGKAGNHHACFNTECANTSDPTQLSAASNCSLTPVSSETSATSRAHRHETTGEITGRKKRSDKNDESLPKPRASVSGIRVLKGQRFEGKRKVEAGRSSTGTVRKDLKVVGSGSASGTSCVAVGVAS